MINKTDKIKAPPLFSKGCLTFKDSNHTLVKDGNFYRCSEKTKGFCLKKNEKLIKAINIERSLGRLREKFILPDNTWSIAYNKVFPIYLKKLFENNNQEADLQDNLEATGNLMIRDLKAKKTIKKSDFSEFKRVFFELSKIYYENLLAGCFLNFVFSLIKTEKEQNEMASHFKKILKIKKKDLNHAFSLNVKKIYISGDGIIENIEFEGFSWFCFLYLQRIIPEYKPKIESSLILNTKKFMSLNYEEVIKEEFKRNGFKNTFSYNAFETKYSKEKYLNKIFEGFKKLSINKKIDYLMKLNSLTRENMYAMFATLIRIN